MCPKLINMKERSVCDFCVLFLSCVIPSELDAVNPELNDFRDQCFVFVLTQMMDHQSGYGLEMLFECVIVKH